MPLLFNLLNIFGSGKGEEKYANNVSADMLIRFAKRRRSLDDNALDQAINMTQKEMDEFEYPLKGEVTTGQLYEHYARILFSLDEKLNEVKAFM